MYQNKITLSPEEILKKEFRIDTRGYRLKEVDQYLDTIIGDYEQFFEIIDDSDTDNNSDTDNGSDTDNNPDSNMYSES